MEKKAKSAHNTYSKFLPKAVYVSIAVRVLYVHFQKWKQDNKIYRYGNKIIGLFR